MLQVSQSGSTSTLISGYTGPRSIDELAGEAARRALELKQLATKNARTRKKKALVDFFAALAEVGVSRRRSAVPAVERDPRAWFAQVRIWTPILKVTYAVIVRDD